MFLLMVIEYNKRYSEPALPLPIADTGWKYENHRSNHDADEHAKKRGTTQLTTGLLCVDFIHQKLLPYVVKRYLNFIYV